ncbi:MAG: phosphoglycerate dehydrogenase [Phycisphaerae bacterium]|nr:phosphoglycerate dehydrogenase [Phycisphaerae bacterium]
MNAILFEQVHANADPILRDAGLAVERHAGAGDESTLPRAVRDAAVLGVRSRTQLRRDALESASRLLAVGCFCIGTDQVDLAAAAKRGIAVFNAPFANTRSVAEMTLAEIVALSRRLFQKSAELHAGRWDKSARDAHEVRGRTLGIVGYGHIGSQLSVLAEAIGLRVIYFDIARRMPLGNAHSLPSLDSLLERADIVSLHVPATPETLRMIGAAQLARMKPGAVLINNARGGVVDLDALAAALRAGRLAGAALDVFPSEPQGGAADFDSPVRGMANVILTPHIGGSTEEAQASIAIEVAEKLVRYLAHGSTSTSVSVPEVDLPSLRDDQLRITHFHRNVPGVLRQMHTALAELGVNINAEYLQSNRELSYVILDVDRAAPASEVERRLAAIPETIRLRLLGPPTTAGSAAA